jgi:WD40 repeat protein
VWQVVRRYVAALSAAFALFACVSAGAALAGTTQLPLASLGEVLVDPANSHVFVSGGSAASSVVVLDFDGNVVTTIASQQGATGMALDQAAGTLYVALRNVSAISRINTTTPTETGRFTTTGMSAPGRVALAGGRVWFSYNCMDSGGVGSAALNGTDLQTELGSASSCNRFATTSTNVNLLAASDIGGSSVRLYNVSTGSPVVTAYSFSPGGAANIRHLVFAPDGGDLFIASGSPYSVQSFSVPGFTLSGSYATGPYPIAAAVTADGAYVAGGADAHYNDDVFVFDAVTGDEIRRWRATRFSTAGLPSVRMRAVCSQ